FFLTVFALALLGRAAAGATDPNDTQPASVSVSERVLRMTEYFDTMLPGVLQENNVTLHFTPKFSDLRDRQFVRYPFEVRYGATDKWEISGGLTPFSPQPLRKGRDHRWGLGEAELATRYDLDGSVPFFNDTTIGVENRVPLGKPPIDLNDHYTHIKPFVSSARSLHIWPDVTFYLNLSYDRSVQLTERAPPPPEVVRRNILEVAPGLLYKPDEFGYFVEYRWQRIGDPFGFHLRHEEEFGTIWDIPRAKTAKFNLPGKWQLELAYKLSQEEGVGHDQGLAARVNWRTT